MKKVVSILLAIVMMLSLVACGDKPIDDPVNTEPKILKMAEGQAPANAWGPASNTTASMSIQRYISGTLYTDLPVDGKVSLAPLLAAAEPVDVNGDGKTWNIAISPNAKWENGEAITADTFMYTFKTVLDPKLLLSNGANLGKNMVTVVNASEYYSQAGSDKTVAWEDVGFKKVDEMTIQLILANPATPTQVMRQFSLLNSTPVYQPLFEQCLSADGASTTYGSTKDTIISSGAFKFTNAVEGSIYEFAKNENFVRADLIKLDGATVSIIEDKGTQLQMFEQGELDYIELDAAGQDKFGDDPRVSTVPARQTFSIEYNSNNTENPIVSNENFRLALYYGTDRAQLSKLTRKLPAVGVLSPYYLAATDGTTFRELAADAGYEPKDYGYDPELAKQYFEKALQESGQSSIELTMLCNSDANHETHCEFLQESWTNLFGADKFKMNIDAQPSAQTSALRKASWKDNYNSYEMVFTGWSFSTADYDPIIALKAYTNTYASRNAAYEFDVLNDLYNDSFNYTLDQNKRNELAMEMEEYIIDHAIVIPLTYNITSCVYSDRVQPPVGQYVTGIGWGWHYADITE